jgi:uncharacterized HAD superfamily protein
MNFASDLDGTLTNESIGDYIDNKDIKDPEVIKGAKQMASRFTPKKGVDVLSKKKLSPVIITGREEYLRHVTEIWLYTHNIPFKELIMVPLGYYGKAFDWNKYVNFKIVEHKKRRIDFALEDKQAIVTILNGVGIPTFRVTDDFEKTLNTAMEKIK